MRIGVIVLLALMGTSTATLDMGGLAGTAVGIAGGAAGLAKTVLPGKIMLPLLAPGLLLYKLSKLGILAKVPFLAAITAKKYALLHAKLNMAKAAVSSVYHTKKAILEMPLKLGAMKVGAIAGAKAGAEVGLSSFNKLPKPQFLHTVVIPASALLSQTGSVATPPASNPSKQSPDHEPEEEPAALAEEPETATSMTTEPPIADDIEATPAEESNVR